MKFCVSCGEKLGDTNRFCPVCGTQCADGLTAPSEPAQSAIQPAADTAQAEKITEYLFYAKRLEGRKFALQQLRQSLLDKAGQLRRPTPPQLQPRVSGMRFNAFPIVFMLLAVVLFPILYISTANDSLPILTLLFFYWIFTPDGWGSLFGAAAISAAICLFIDAFPFFSKVMQNKAIEQENESARAIAHSVDHGNAQKAAILEQEAREVAHEIAAADSMLGKLYAVDLLYPKYRNMVAVATMYEYFDAQRCYTLSGRDGAYNIFENELRMDKIIGQLDSVLLQLYAIRQTQQELYRLLDDSLTCAQQTYEASCAMAESLREVKLSAANAEYSARITRENSEFLTYFAMLKS